MPKEAVSLLNSKSLNWPEMKIEFVSVRKFTTILQPDIGESLEVRDECMP